MWHAARMVQHTAHGLMGLAHEHMLMGLAHEHMLMSPAQEHLLMGLAHGLARGQA